MAQWYPTREILRFGRVWSQKRRQSSTPQVPCVQCMCVYNVCVCVDAYAIGCGVLATIEQWYPTREFNGTMVPHKRNSKVWPGLVTKEKTMKYPTSAMCTVYVCIQCVCVCVDAYAIGCGVLATIEQWYPTREFNGTMVPHKRNSKVWPGLVTKEKTMKYPTSAMCTVQCVRACSVGEYTGWERVGGIVAGG